VAASSVGGKLDLVAWLSALLLIDPVSDARNDVAAPGAVMTLEESRT